MNIVILWGAFFVEGYWRGCALFHHCTNPQGYQAETPKKLLTHQLV
jgi:hypothetical protein